MKRFLSVALAAVMLVALVLSLSSCSVYSGIERNFVNAGYEVVDTTDEEGNDALAFVADLKEDGEVSCTVHILKKKIGEVPVVNTPIEIYAVILEYGAEGEAREKFEEMKQDASTKDMLEDAEESELIKGNCVLIPIPNVLSLATMEADYNQMVELFNK